VSVLDRFQLDGRRAFVTGGSRGLGREVVLALAEAGADVLLVGRDAESLERTAGDVRQRGRLAIPVVGDVGMPAECEALCRAAVDEHGPFDVLVNNVGGRREATPVEEQSLAEWQRLIDLNLTSTFLCTGILGGAMREAGIRGRVINVSSINAFVAGRAIGGGRHYETAKAGIVGFTRAVAVDWAPHGITVNAICPGGFMTEANERWARERPEVIERFLANVPAGEYGPPEDIGALAVYLASDAARYVTGTTIVIDGGYTCW
jgi:NAD(P)-dependent dehydrogenase (short-subunit alcohol dehydrogenase family)